MPAAESSGDNPNSSNGIRRPMKKPLFQQLEPVSLPERAANALKDAFFSGQLKPGDTIVEREIARQMKVGTPVVREALILLQEQGFVRRVANTGTFVTEF